MACHPKRGLRCGAILGALFGLACGGSGGEGKAPAAEGPEANRAPVLRSLSLSPSPPRPGRTIRALAVAHDPDGDVPTLSYQWSVRGRPVAEGGASLRLPDLRKGDAVAVRVVASDGRSHSEVRSAEARVANSRPRLLDLRVRSERREGVEHWVVEPLADDPDRDPLEYEFAWRLNGRDTDVARDAYPAASLQRGDVLSVRVVASDGEDESQVLESAPVEIANSAPEIVSRPQGLDARGEFHYEVEAEDADGDRGLRYELVEAPEGMEIDGLSGEVSWRPRLDQAGEHRVEIAVDDRKGGRSSQVFRLPVETIEAPPAAPGP